MGDRVPQSPQGNIGSVKIWIYYIGRAKDGNANGMTEEYLKRVSRYVKCAMAEIRPERVNPWEKHGAALKVLLDPGGDVIDSRQFCAWIGKLEMEGRDVCFLLGGADGLPEQWRRKQAIRLSLSAMTYSHELARAMLAEQIYRAYTALRGHPYPR